MSEFGGNRFEGERIPEDNRQEFMPNLEAEQGFRDLFSDDFDGLEHINSEYKEHNVDSVEVIKELFADDFKESIDNYEKDKVETSHDDIPHKEESNNREGNPDNNVKENNDVTDNPEYDEVGTRELTDEEKQELQDKLGWPDKKINDNCRIDKDGVIHYKTDCQDKEGTTSECGVPYERKTIEYKGVKIEGVFPVFESTFNTELDERDYQSSNCKQFSECNKKLKEAVENDPDLKSQFSEEQIEDIENVRTPRGYTWHHTEEPGRMQLVKTEDHDKRIGGAAHTGGNSIWGNKSVDKGIEENEQKGEAF